MKTIILNEEQIKALNQFISEIPTKYGVPLIEFFSKIEQGQKKEEDERNS